MKSELAWGSQSSYARLSNTESPAEHYQAQPDSGPVKQASPLSSVLVCNLLILSNHAAVYRYEYSHFKVRKTEAQEDSRKVAGGGWWVVVLAYV